MKKIISYLPIMQIAICILCFIFMYIPVFKCVGTTFNAFYTILGVKSGSYDVFTFSFLAMIPYIILLIIILINVVFDNKKSFIIHIIKGVLFLVSAILFFMILRLLNPADYYQNLDEALNLVTPLCGHIITGVVALIGFGSCILEIYGDLKKEN